MAGSPAAPTALVSTGPRLVAKRCCPSTPPSAPVPPQAYKIKRQLKAGGAGAAAVEGGAAATEGSTKGADGAAAVGAAGHQPSPFDAPSDPLHVHGQLVHHEVHHLPALKEADVENGSGDLTGMASGLSSIRSRRVSVRASGDMSVVNSAPIPDLLPPGGGWVGRGDVASR